MHIADVESNNLGANGIVAGGLPIAAGVGLSIQLRGTDQVCLVLFGDGAANEGAFHESLNMAAIWHLPVVFFCENNQYAMSMSIERAFNIEHISQRACATASRASRSTATTRWPCRMRSRGRGGARPRRGRPDAESKSVTYRWKGHSKSDRQLTAPVKKSRNGRPRTPSPALPSG